MHSSCVRLGLSVYLKWPRNNWRVCYHVSSACAADSAERNLVPERFLRLSRQRASKISKKAKRTEKPNASKKEYLYGVSPCLAALEANRRKIYTIYFNEEAVNMKKRPQFDKIRTIATKRIITTKTVSRRWLDDLCGHRPHQNIVMKVSNLNTILLEDSYGDSDLETEKSLNRPPLWLVLEEVQDPMNLGAILRTSAYLGVDKVVNSDSDSCSLTPAVSKASAGAMEGLPLYSTNVIQLLKKKKAKSWEILGTAHSHFVPKSKLQSVVACDQFRLKKPSLLVLGNEGKGLSSEAQMLCSKFLTIQSQMTQSFGDLDSLNVSVAGGILLHSLLSSRNY